jgi:hypothetical protein
MTSSKFLPISPTARRKALFVLVTTFIFACLGFVTTLATGRPLELGPWKPSRGFQARFASTNISRRSRTPRRHDGGWTKRGAAVVS